MKNEFENKIRFELLNLLSKNPELTQRQMQKQLEVSLGKVNKCLSKLAEKGWIKVDRFKKADNKPAYLYTITTAGYQEVINLNLQLLQTKISEYSEIKNEIDQLTGQLDALDPDLIRRTEIKNKLDQIGF